MNKGFSRCHGRRKAGMRWVKPARTLFGWVLMGLSSWNSTARNHLGRLPAAASRTRRCARIDGDGRGASRRLADRPEHTPHHGRPASAVSVHRRDSRRGRRRRGWSARIANERPYAGRFGRHHGLATVGYPLRRAERMPGGLAIGDRFARKADGGRRLEAIREIQVKLRCDKGLHQLSYQLPG